MSSNRDNGIKCCKECGTSMLSGSGDLCEACKAKNTRKQYLELLKAEEHIKKDADWLKNYSGWTNILVIPIIIIILVAFFYALSMFTNT